MNRWAILAVLFLVRVTMAFQFQAVAALSPIVMERFAIGLADIGLLIGLYLSPGIVIAFPGGAIGRRFGDRRVVAVAMALMAIGGSMMTLSPTWEAQLAGRLIAGVGGVIMNVLLSKMVTDWFAGRELATAMGLFVNSWPVGIAGALLMLPFIADIAGFQAAMAAVTLFVLFGLVLMTTAYRSPAAASTPMARGGRLTRASLAGVLVAGLIWGLYNSALGMIFSFGPAMLAERGWSLASASSTTSIVMWLVAASVPLGGFLADRLNRRDLILFIGLLTFAAVMVAAPMTDAVLPAFVALGVLGGLAAGPIMSLPADFLEPENRAQGMGIFYTIFYAMIFVTPVLAGWIAEISGSAGATFALGAVMLVLCCITLAGLRASQRNPMRSPTAT